MSLDRIIQNTLRDQAIKQTEILEQIFNEIVKIRLDLHKICIHDFSEGNICGKCGLEKTSSNKNGVKKHGS